MTNTIAGVPADELEIDLKGVRLRLARARNLAAFVNRDEQLTAAAPPEPPYWMHLWPGALALARLVAVSPDVGAGTRVIEVGCGLGLPSIAAARRGAHVVASDWKCEPLLFARRSAIRNGCSVQTVQMSWTAPAFTSSFDLCLAADVSYDRSMLANLCSTLGRLVHRGGQVWLAESVNTGNDELVRCLIGFGFEARTATVQEEEEGRVVWVRLIRAGWSP